MPSAEPSAPVPIAPARLSPLERAGRIFTKPATAWDDLQERGQWAAPLLAGMAIWIGLQAAVYHHVTVPMMQTAWEDAVANGRMEQSTMDNLLHFFGETAGGMGVVLGQQALVWPILAL